MTISPEPGPESGAGRGASDVSRAPGAWPTGLSREAHETTGDAAAQQTNRPNRLLAALPVSEYAVLAPHLEPVAVTAMQILVEAGAPLDHVYFPETTMLSLLRRMRDGTSVETGTAGRDAMAGLPALRGRATASVTIAALVPGMCLRMSAAVLREHLPELPTLSSLLGRYALAFMEQLGQIVACNSLHSVEQRCTRWLLTAHDAVGGDEVQVTQEALAQMLGVRRAGVSGVALMLQRDRMIRYARGRVTILDRAGLEAVACECYAVVRASSAECSRSAAPPST
jgi:CRP-like cAMP-binding protein